MENKKVVLKERDGKDILEFEILCNEKIEININSKDQSDLRKLFYRVIEETMKAPFVFELFIEDGYNKTLYIDVSTEYIGQLNLEISKVIEEMPLELKQ